MANDIKQKKFLLKDHLFNKLKVEKISKEIKNVFGDFDSKKFEKQVLDGFPERELKERIAWIRECLKKHLPQDYRESVSILIKSLPEPCSPMLSDNDFGDFIYAPYTDFVAKYGCSEVYLHFSFGALKEMTTRFSAEDAIRYFINAFPKETIAVLKEWTKDPHYHVRRLASEGTRPTLPWSQKINIPITDAIPILNNLFYDSTRFVTRSVANHVNDISKVSPALVVSLLEKWKESGKQRSNEMDYIIRHSLRTLVKQGDPEALRLLGISSKPNIQLTNFTMPKLVFMNEDLKFSFDILAKENTTLIVDYIIHFQNKLGKMNNKKVYKMKKLDMVKGETKTLSKKHFFKQFMTTRTLYAGKHQIELQINGCIFIKNEFELKG